MFQVGIYCRVSVEERERENEYSNSIRSQIQMGEDYIAEHDDVEKTDIYADDGESGSHFERWEFQRMIADIELGRIDMILIKDVSRLGREHIDTNYYLGKYFPSKGVRVVSLLDDYDSQTNRYDEMLEIKTLLNDMYLRDISKKIKTTIQIKRNMGEYTTGEAPFGYLRSKMIHNHLEVDAYAAGIVKRIFHMYLAGKGYTIIARTLNEEGIPSPAKYKKEVVKQDYPWRVGKGIWTSSAIAGVLKNPHYTGAVVLRKIEKPSYKLQYRKVLRVEEQELCENAHEAIISKEIFNKVQEMRRSKKVVYFDNAASPHKYVGLLLCGKCGYSMSKRYSASRGVYDGYMCGAHQKVGQNFCELNHIDFEKLDELVAFAVNQQLIKRKKELYTMERQYAGVSENSIEVNERIIVKIQRNKEYQKKAYEQFVDDVISKEAYLELKKMYQKENEQYEKEMQKELQDSQKKNQMKQETVEWVSKFRRGRITAKQLTRDVLVELVDKIYIYPDRKIDIHFNFKSIEE